MFMISDANILIDLEEGELIEQLFKLPFNLYCPRLNMFCSVMMSLRHRLYLGLLERRTPKW